jgi:HD-GYP domain-containing protein (c-di-GMP phosphodiesterase class II)
MIGGRPWKAGPYGVRDGPLAYAAAMATQAHAGTSRQPGKGSIRAAEIVGALALATDLGTGQPLEHSLRTAVLSMHLGQLAGATEQELADTYYVALLHSAGCTSDGHEAAQLYGEDIMPRAVFALVDAGNPAEVLAFLQTYVGANQDPDVRSAMVEQAVAHGLPMARQTFAMHCEVAQRFANWLGFGPGIQEALAHVFERWDGLGFPAVTGGEAIPLSMRLLHVARDISVFLTAAGPDEARAVIARRSGTAYDPRLADLAVAHFDALLGGLDETRMWEQALRTEPAPQVWMDDDAIDAAFTAIAAFTNLKSPWLREHSTGVAELAEAAAWRLDLPADQVALVRRAALAHDLGRVGVSNAIWEKPGPLGFGEWERVRLHPHFTERAFAQSAALAPIGMIGGAHHERLDGSGYHRGTRKPLLDQAACLVAAADCYVAMREDRPYRAALDAATAEAQLVGDAEAGRLDAAAVDAVLAAAGHRARRRPSEVPAGLTSRELEVLLVLVSGSSNQQIAEQLGISAKTVGHHIQHIYGKAGVRSRAAATLWAFEHALVGGG